jgi:hypothetical protein
MTCSFVLQVVLTVLLNQGFGVTVISVPQNDWVTQGSIGGTTDTFQLVDDAPTSGWGYARARTDGRVGINANKGISSVSGLGDRAPVVFFTPAVTQGTTFTDKADVEFRGAPPFTPSSTTLADTMGVNNLGLLSQLSALSYNFYKSVPSSTPSTAVAPSLRVWVDLDGVLTTTTDRVFLVYEYYYASNGGANPPENSWTNVAITGTTGGNFWVAGTCTGCSGGPFGQANTYPLDYYKSNLPVTATIIAFNMGIGSNWGVEFLGAIDEPAWTINGVTSSFAFSVIPSSATE